MHIERRSCRASADIRQSGRRERISDISPSANFSAKAGTRSSSGQWAVPATALGLGYRFKVGTLRQAMRQLAGAA